ncbi:sugar transferase [Yoonia maritima]|uniref:sugar transferase n=1 Tax=Yoonia maritima TaxID=1435347 RepID=UPI000D10A283|nr:sugar transferase [Yoonia maritima]
MFDLHNDTVLQGHVIPKQPVSQPWPKLIFDKCVALLLLVPLMVFAAVLVMLNPFVNAGPLIFVQRRMGQDCLPFDVIKFRTMRPAPVARGAFDPLDVDRVTRLGRWLRKTRIDELPQVINVLRGEMSLIGPRPDCYDHARVYLRDIPGYAARHRVLPGISGYAQTELGYIDSIGAVRRKVAADLYYIANASFRLDMQIAWRTLIVVLARRGA